MLKLRGIFNPRVRLAIAAIFLAPCALVVWSAWNHRTVVHGVSLDLKLCPIGLGIGLTIGVFVGRWRLRGLRDAFSEAHDKPLFTQLSIIARCLGERKARAIERAAYLALILFWVGLIPLRLSGVILPIAISATYILGIHLTGSLLPFIRLWRECRAILLGPDARGHYERETEPNFERTKLPHGNEIRLRWAFNPILQVIWGLVLSVVVGTIAAISIQIDPARLDPVVAPVAFIAGLMIGYPLGKRRLHALHQVLPQIDGKFVFAQWDVMATVPEGALVVKFQGWIWAVAVLGAFGVPALTGGRIILAGSLALLGLGAHLTGKTLPFVRLWSAQARHRKSQSWQS